MDVVRLFDFEDAEFTHYFYFQGEKYINCIQYMDEIYDFCESYPTQDDVQFKRYARRSAKLAFYELLNKRARAGTLKSCSPACTSPRTT